MRRSACAPIQVRMSSNLWALVYYGIYKMPQQQWLRSGIPSHLCAFKLDLESEKLWLVCISAYYIPFLVDFFFIHLYERWLLWDRWSKQIFAPSSKVFHKIILSTIWSSQQQHPFGMNLAILPFFINHLR